MQVPDQEITLPGNAQLNGTATDDGLPRGSTLETFWSFVSGPAPVIFPDATLLNAIAIFTTPGTYVLRLTASDGKLSASDELTIVVKPKPFAERTYTLDAALRRRATCSTSFTTSPTSCNWTTRRANSTSCGSPCLRKARSSRSIPPQDR